MTTKAQEREAMEKIKKIVMGLGEDSYIGTAMIGVWEIMEENIENDFAISAKDRMNEASRAARETEKRIVAISAEKDAEICGLKAKVADLERDLSETKEDLLYHSQKADEYSDALANTNAVCNEWAERNGAMAAENERMKQEIVNLKAKLFDMLAEKGIV